MMLAIRLAYALLFLSLCAQGLPLPTIPLNERQQEISWQAWLLVDDQNQHRQNNEEGTLPRRRITTKSVFVAPTLAGPFPDNLPPCADGYKSNPMGVCTKIIKIDEDRHLAFLVSKLNEKFGIEDYEEEFEEVDASDNEPLQVNIPLGDQYNNDPPQEESDFAIIVTPTIKNVDGKSNVDKREDEVVGETIEQELKKLLKTTTDQYDGTTWGMNVEHLGGTTETTITLNRMEEIKEETTTFSEEITGATNRGEETTVVFDDHKTTTFIDPTYETSEIPSTTTLPTTEEVTTVTEHYKITTTTPKITTYHPKATTYHPYFDMKYFENSKTRNIIKFPDDDAVAPRSHSQGNYVRFPDMESGYQQESESHHTRDVTDNFGNYFNEIVTPEPSQKVRQMVLPSKKGFVPSKNYPIVFPHSDSNHRQYEYHWGATTESNHNKRIRDKQGNLFLLPPKWSEKSNQKPLVFRFSRKNFAFDPDKLKNNVFYRSLPMQDLSVLFGYKNEQTVHR